MKKLGLLLTLGLGLVACEKVEDVMELPMPQVMVAPIDKETENVPPTTNTGTSSNTVQTGTDSTTTLTTTSTTNIDEDKDDTEVEEMPNDLDQNASTYATIATGEGELSVVATQVEFGIEVILTMTPANGFDVLDVQGADLVDGYKFSTLQGDDITPVGSKSINIVFKEGSIEPVQVYFQRNVFHNTVGFENSFEFNQQRPTGYGDAESTLNIALDHATYRMEQAILTTKMLWIPNNLELPNGVIETRVAHTAGGTQCNHDHNSTAYINMLHSGDAGIVFHELGHTFDDNCSITEEQNLRSDELYILYINREFEQRGMPTVSSWDDLVADPRHREIEGYQFNGGHGEWFACAVSAYHNTSGNWTTNGGNGSIGNRNDLQNKYPLMFDLMEEIFE